MYKKIKRLILFLLPLIGVLHSCALEEPIVGDLCETQGDVAEGIILEMLSLECVLSGQDNFVVRDSASFSDLFADCPTPFSIPAINFETASVLGISATATGCERYFRRRVEELPDEQIYVYRLEIQECGMCEPLVLQNHWAVVPKVPDDYLVIFEVIYL